MDIFYLLNVLKSRLWILIIVPMIAGGIAFAFVYNSPKKFKSSAQLATGFTTEETVRMTDEKFNRVRSDLQFFNLIEKINSEAVISLVSYNLILHDLKSDTPFKILDDSIGIPKERAIEIYQNKLDSLQLLSSYDREEIRLIEFLRSNGYSSFWLKESGLGIRRVGNTDFITINYTSENPRLSAFVVNKVCEEFIRYNKSITTNLAEESVQFLANLVDEKKEVLDETKQVLNNFKTSNQVLNYKLESESKIAQTAEYEVRKQEEEKNIHALRLSINRIDAKLSTFGTQANNNAKILELRNRINQLNKMYIDGGSQDEQLRSTIANLRDQLQVEMSKNAAQSDSDGVSKEELQAQKEQYQLELEIAISNLASINSTLSRLKSQLTGFTDKETKLSVLQEDVENATKDYNNALERYNEYKNKSLVSGASIRQIKFGQPAIEPESSNTIIITGLAGVASFGICVFFIFFMEFIDFRIKTPSQFSKMTKMELAGSVNKINLKNFNLESLFGEEVQAEELTTFKELLRKIRYELESKKARTVLVTSTKIKEGKTMMIISLAYSLSLINKRVLIIDTNFKNNSLTKLLVAKPKFDKLLEEGRVVNGNLLLNPKNGNGEQSEEDENQDDYNVISRTAHDNIDIIGSYHATNSPLEILSGRDFEGMITKFKEWYDYVLLEGASLNQYPDTKELIEFADVVLPVFSADSAIKSIDQDSIKYLKSLNGKLMGSILNKVDIKNL